jgi:DNA-binding NarL/FixJ family response regulator
MSETTLDTPVSKIEIKEQHVGTSYNEAKIRNHKSLSEREREILLLMSHGLKTREIASKLNLSSKTVETHRVNIRAKLQIKRVKELAACASRYLQED